MRTIGSSATGAPDPRSCRPGLWPTARPCPRASSILRSGNGMPRTAVKLRCVRCCRLRDFRWRRWPDAFLEHPSGSDRWIKPIGTAREIESKNCRAQDSEPDPAAPTHLHLVRRQLEAFILEDPSGIHKSQQGDSPEIAEGDQVVTDLQISEQHVLAGKAPGVERAVGVLAAQNRDLVFPGRDHVPGIE